MANEDCSAWLPAPLVLPITGRIPMITITITIKELPGCQVGQMIQNHPENPTYRERFFGAEILAAIDSIQAGKKLLKSTEAIWKKTTPPSA